MSLYYVRVELSAMCVEMNHTLLFEWIPSLMWAKRVEFNIGPISFKYDAPSSFWCLRARPQYVCFRFQCFPCFPNTNEVSSATNCTQTADRSITKYRSHLFIHLFIIDRPQPHTLIIQLVLYSDRFNSRVRQTWILFLKHLYIWYPSWIPMALQNGTQEQSQQR